MTLSHIVTALSTAEARALHRRMSFRSWQAEQSMRAERVRLYRNYADGDHRAEMTKEMRQMLRIGTLDETNLSKQLASGTNSDSVRFNDNYMDIVIQTMADRLKLDAVLAPKNDDGTQWIADLFSVNRMDALQGDVHGAAIRDADTYVMVPWDEKRQHVALTHEPAYDGKNGMLVVAAPDNTIAAAIKVWVTSNSSLGDTTRVNVYYPDRIEKYISVDGDSLRRFEETGTPWPIPLLYKGEPLGVPIVHFPNRGTTYDFYGQSEIANAIPLQDALNRTMYSMVMTAELTGFGVRWIKGAKFPAAIMPGGVLNLGDGMPLDKDQVVEVGMLEQGQITPFIEQAQWLTAEIGKITRTPAPEFVGPTASGEARKQAEIGLLGKVRRFQVKAGNRWEDVVRLAARVQTAFGTSAGPEFDTLTAVWDEAELRNDTDVINNAKALAELGLVAEALRQMATVFDWDEEKINELLIERQQAQAATLASIIGNQNVPTFDNLLAGVPAL